MAPYCILRCLAPKILRRGALEDRAYLLPGQQISGRQAAATTNQPGHRCRRYKLVRPVGSPWISFRISLRGWVSTGNLRGSGAYPPTRFTACRERLSGYLPTPGPFSDTHPPPQRHVTVVTVVTVVTTSRPASRGPTNVDRPLSSFAVSRSRSAHGRANLLPLVTCLAAHRSLHDSERLLSTRLRSARTAPGGANGVRRRP